MRFGHPAGDWQSESGAAGRSRRVQPHEALEDAFAVLERDPDTSIGHLKSDLSIGLEKRD